MYCGKCGVKALEGTKFCQNCGAVLIKNIQTKNGYDADREAITEARPYEETAQDYPRAVEFTGVPEPSTVTAPNISDVEIKPALPNVNPIPQPFPETIPDSFPDPTMTSGVSVTGITENEINNTNSYRREFDDLFENNPIEFKNIFSTDDNKHSNNYTEYSSIGDNIKREFNMKHEEGLNPNFDVNLINEKEKIYFGKTAFVCCLLIIAVLSVLCGVFGGLYVRSIEKKSLTNSIVSGIITQDTYERNEG